MMSMDLGLSDAKSLKFWRKIVAEFVGCVLLLMCVVCITCSLNSKQSTVIEISLGIGFAFATLSYAFDHISGGHLNSIVSIAMVTCGRMSLFQGIMYVCAQLLGAIIGSALTFACLPDTSANDNLLLTTITSLNPEVEPPQGFGLESLFTFLLVFFILSITDPVKRVHPCAKVVGIGMAVTACHICLVPFTGCGLNPARSLGPAIVTGTWTHHWIYWLGPISGGVVASVFYNFVFFVSLEDMAVGKDLVMIGGSGRRSRGRK